MSVNILMFGWEFPPYNIGGLGVACEGIVDALSLRGESMTVVLPKKLESTNNQVNFVYPKQMQCVKVQYFDSLIIPYMNESIYQTEYQNSLENIYSPDLFSEVQRYIDVVAQIKNLESFDIIHCHDWLTLPAAIEAKRVTNKPLVFHIHATEIDRTGGNCNSQIFEIEKKGFEITDVIIAVSNFTKQSIIKNYHIDSDKIQVIHNGIDYQKHLISKVDVSLKEKLTSLKKSGFQIVLYTGRLTFQKGINYLLLAAQKSLSTNSKIFFIIIGGGDMEKELIRLASELKISDRIIFTGFLRGRELFSLYEIADLFVMPSVSEPFGLVALESALYNTPVLISKQSGVAEVLLNCLKVDFWDIDDMVDKILAVLEYKVLHTTLKQNAYKETKTISWTNSANKISVLYNKLLEN